MTGKNNRKALAMMKYLGNGFLIGVPARDLTKAEVEALGLDPDALAESGMYEKVQSPPPSGAAKPETGSGDAAEPLQDE